MKGLSTSIFFTLAVFLFVGIYSGQVIARDFHVDRKGNFKDSKDIIKNIILDYPSFGQDRHNRYKLSGVEEIRIVEKNDDNDFYIWTYVNDVKVYKYFSHIVVKESNNGVITITNTVPTENSIRRLKNATGLPNFSFFNYSKVVWTIEEKKDLQGNFLYTHVYYVADFSASGFAATLGAGRISATLETIATQLFAALGERY
ncbi:MAG: hypothetical protein HQK53_13105 [Oligoflexia bacterium]|nr:hypothetical protein [Oligoflexia bacterium]